MGAWIEIGKYPVISKSGGVALYMGAWIEMDRLGLTPKSFEVALYMGAWIEIRIATTSFLPF